jgi:hypothetical protein
VILDSEEITLHRFDFLEEDLDRSVLRRYPPRLHEVLDEVLGQSQEEVPPERVVVWPLDHTISVTLKIIVEGQCAFCFDKFSFLIFISGALRRYSMYEAFI